MTFWEIVGVVLSWLARKVIGPLFAIAAVMVWRWLSGADMLRGGRRTGARFMYASAPPWRAAPRFGVRVNWSYWPGWQRAVVRVAFTALMVAVIVEPIWTGVTVTVVVAATAAAAAVSRRRARPIRVKLLTRAPAPRPVLAARAAVADTEASADYVSV